LLLERCRIKVPVEDVHAVAGIEGKSGEGGGSRGRNGVFARRWEYRHRSHSLDELLADNYWGALDLSNSHQARSLLRPGDEISFVLQVGEKLPSRWIRGTIVIETVPTSKKEPVVASVLQLLPACTFPKANGKAA